MAADGRMIAGEDGPETPSGKKAKDENFPVASILLPGRLRHHVRLFYDFARAADDIADNPGLDPDDRSQDSIVSPMPSSLRMDRMGFPSRGIACAEASRRRASHRGTASISSKPSGRTQDNRAARPGRTSSTTAISRQLLSDAISSIFTASRIRPTPLPTPSAMPFRYSTTCRTAGRTSGT